MRRAAIALAATLLASPALASPAIAQDTPLPPPAHATPAQESAGLAYRQLGLALQQVFRELDALRAKDEADKPKPAPAAPSQDMPK